MFPASKSACSVICLLMALVGPTCAAPTDEAMSDRPTATSNDTTGAKPTDRVATPDISSGSRTVDMLIELQGKQAGLAFTAAERAAARTDTPAPKTDSAGQTAGAAAPTPSRAGLFGSGAIPVAPPRDAAPTTTANREAEWQPGSAQRSSADGPAAGAAPRAYESGLAHGEDRISMPRTVVAWIRENRALVIGVAVVVLVAVGAASMGVGQRRR
jgi:hypothetical protein